MPIALFAALAGSLAIHAAALLGTDIELFGGGQEAEPVPLRAELRPPPPAERAGRPAIATGAGFPAAGRPAGEAAAPGQRRRVASRRARDRGTDHGNRP